MLTPERFGSARVLLLQLRDVITVWPHRLQLHRLPAAVCVVTTEHILQNNWPTPAIRQQVVEARNELVGIVPGSDQDETQKRSFSEIEFAIPIFLEQCLERS